MEATTYPHDLSSRVPRSPSGSSAVSVATDDGESSAESKVSTGTIRPDAAPPVFEINPATLYTRCNLAAVFKVDPKTIDRWAKQPSEELPPPFYQKRTPYWMGSELLKFFKRKQSRAVEAVAI